jgi:hypothetical protein
MNMNITIDGGIFEYNCSDFVEEVGIHPPLGPSLEIPESFAIYIAFLFLTLTFVNFGSALFPKYSVCSEESYLKPLDPEYHDGLQVETPVGLQVETPVGLQVQIPVEDGKHIRYVSKILDDSEFSTLGDKIVQMSSLRSSSPDATESTLKRIRAFDQKKRGTCLPSGACPAVGPQYANFVCPSGSIITGSVTSSEVRFRMDYRRACVERAPNMGSWGM